MLWIKLNLFPLQNADVEMDPSVPAFTQGSPGEASENAEDEAEILADQDVTNKLDFAADDENMGALSNSVEPMEEEPASFMRGEVDVKEQMDRTALELDASIHGHASLDDEDDPTTELGAAYRDTPGGLEEVAQKTDEEMARRKGLKH